MKNFENLPNFRNDQNSSKFRRILIGFENFDQFRNWFEIFAPKRNSVEFCFEKGDRNEIGHFDQFRNTLGSTSIQL